MVDITHKSNTLRKAIAQAIIVVSKPETIIAIQERKVPKGDIFEFARAAGLLGVKKTSDLIPDCHPLPIEFTSINYEIQGLQLLITVEVHTIYKTGVEVEAMHGASITALTIYDMLKPIDKGVEIHHIKLLQKTGGKSDLKNLKFDSIKAAVMVCSDRVSTGTTQDHSGKKIISRLQELGIDTLSYEVVADDKQTINEMAKSLCTEQHQLLILTGGTGLSPRDVTPEAVLPLIDRPIDGIMETARNYGQERMPYAMLSRGVAGFCGNTLILTFPGSTNGVNEYMSALFPQVLHLFAINKGQQH